MSSSELLSSEDELLAVFDLTSGCFSLVLIGVSSSELLSSEPDKSSELELGLSGFEGNFGALFSLP